MCECLDNWGLLHVNKFATPVSLQEMGHGCIWLSVSHLSHFTLKTGRI